MARDRDGIAMRDLRTLFTVGVTTGLTDGQLLERFTARSDAAAERAFATLIERHGPMVYAPVAVSSATITTPRMPSRRHS